MEKDEKELENKVTRRKKVNEPVETKEVQIIKNNNTGLIVLNIILICLLAAGCLYEFYLKDSVFKNDKPVNANVNTYVSGNSSEKKNITITETGLADAVEKVYDAVVVIENYSGTKVVSSGSGFVFKTDDKYGYILTNNHVINGSKDIKVTFTNEKTVNATVVGSDDYSDIAVLSVPVSSVVITAETGSSDNMRVGDTTFAVGAPLDSTVYSWSVTRGILSGKNRTVETNESVMEVLQTDAAINAGNSGGPLCNINGEVIGITNMKIASSTIEGIGFAIPIETALDVANALISGERINRPYLGVSIYDAMNRFTWDTGVYINSVEKDSLAENAGIKAGDRIVKIDNVKVTSTANFRFNLYKHKIGDKITITIERDGKEMDFSITLK